MISITIPGVYTMKDKKSIVKENVKAYKKASKKQKTDMLNDLEKVTHWHRKYILTLLNRTNKVYYTPQGIKLVGDPTITYVHNRGRKKKYTKELIPYLKALWVLGHYRYSVHLKAFMAINSTDFLMASLTYTI